MAFAKVRLDSVIEGEKMKKIICCLTKPLRVAAGLLFVLLGSIPTILVPGIGLFLGLPFLLVGGALICC